MNLFILLQYITPQHLLSRIVGALAKSKITFIKNNFIKIFANRYQVNMSEAKKTNLTEYESFNAFFTRELNDTARPIDKNQASVTSPADGAISQIGAIKEGRIFQAKGFDFSCEELLGDTEQAAVFANGNFTTVYLSPKDYHRVHMPFTGQLKKMTYIGGKLFSVNKTTANNVPRLFARNERVVCLFDTDIGPMAVVLVGAMIVAGIETVWSGLIAPNKEAYFSVDFDGSLTIKKGEEMGRFCLGSTAIVLFADNAMQWDLSLSEDSPVKMGQAIGELNNL